MKYHSKRELLADITREYDELRRLLGQIPPRRRQETGVWGDGWTVCDLVAHLVEWQALFLQWFRTGQQGGTPAMPAPGYKWNETPKLNRAIWAKHRGRPFDALEAEFTSSHDAIVDLLDGLSGPDLLEPGRFPWTGKNSLVTYVGPNTASHYRFAQKVLKRWQRGEADA